MAGFGSIPVDANTEMFLLIGAILEAALFVVILILDLVRKGRLGAILPDGVLTFLCYPSGSFKILWCRLYREMLVAKDKSQLFYAHEGTVYHPTGGGPSIAFVDAISEFATNMKVLGYCLFLKKGIASEKYQRFGSIDEAYLWYAEQSLGKMRGKIDTDLYDLRRNKLHLARNLLLMKEKETFAESTIATDGSATEKAGIRETPLPNSKMSDREYEEFIRGIADELASEQGEILPISGVGLSLNDVDRWNRSPAPADTLKAAKEYGEELERRRRKQDNTKIMVFALAFVMIIIAAAIGYTIAK